MLYRELHRVLRTMMLNSSQRTEFWIRVWKCYRSLQQQCTSVIFVLEILIRYSTIGSNVRIHNSNIQRISTDLGYPSRSNEKPRAGGEPVRDVFVNHAFMYKTRALTSGRRHFIRWPSRYVWTSRSPASTILIGWFSSQAVMKLDRTISHNLREDSSH